LPSLVRGQAWRAHCATAQAAGVASQFGEYHQHRVVVLAPVIAGPCALPVSRRLSSKRPPCAPLAPGLLSRPPYHLAGRVGGVKGAILQPKRRRPYRSGSLLRARKGVVRNPLQTHGTGGLLVLEVLGSMGIMWRDATAVDHKIGQYCQRLWYRVDKARATKRPA
jgi:hypothetical protein